MRHFKQHRDGYVIVAVLIVIVVLSLAAYKFTDLMMAEHKAAVRTHDHTQAKLSAVSGVHYVAAALSDPNYFYDQLGGVPTAAGAFHDQNSYITVYEDPNNKRRSRYFYLVSNVPSAPGTYDELQGAVVDEGGKLNLNFLIMLDPSGQKLADALTKLSSTFPLLTADVIDAIVDWMDADDTPRENGAESSAYADLGYKAKNGPLNSLEELLMVRGVTIELLFGNDRNRNGKADDYDGQVLDRGLSDYITVYGRELNLDSTGVLREYINDSEADNLPGLYQRLQAKLDSEMADFIMAYRLMQSSTIQTTSATLMSSDGSGNTLTITIQGTTSNQPKTRPATPAELNAAVQKAMSAASILQQGKRPKSLFDLQNVQITLPKPEGSMPSDPTPVYYSPLANPSRFNELLPLLLDKTTTTTKVELFPRINVNTASDVVLKTIPGLSESDVNNIITMRSNQTPGAAVTVTGAWMAVSGAITPDKFKSIEQYITGQSMVYRAQVVGYGGSEGPAARVEAVIDTNRGAPRILYFRDLSDLDSPRGYTPPPTQ